MNYPASVSDFFKSPKWMMNLLLAGVCFFIPVIGPMVIMGWLITGFWGRDDERPETFPDFDFSFFGKYLERGVWPFLVMLVSGLASALVIAVFLVPLAMFSSLISGGSHGQASGCFGALIAMFMMFCSVAAVVAMMVVLSPLTLRASMVQDFAQSFDFTFMKRFVSLVWKEILLSVLFLLVASMVLTSLGALALCIGMYFAKVPIYFCWMHLHKQLYRLYLSRGGEPVPLSPKVRDLPVVPATPA
jgi:hypothetical protein